MLTSFIHFAARMSGTTSTVPAWRSSAATSSSLPAVSGPRLPTANQEREGGEWRSTTPGSVIIEETSITQPSVRSGPAISATASAVIPFWTPTTRPSAATWGAISSAAQRVS